MSGYTSVEPFVQPRTQRLTVWHSCIGLQHFDSPQPSCSPGNLVKTPILDCLRVTEHGFFLRHDPGRAGSHLHERVVMTRRIAAGALRLQRLTMVYR